MAALSELSLRYRLLLATYRWRVLQPSPWAVPRVPLARARVALVTSAGLLRPGVDAPFHEARGGDPSVRWLPADVDPATLEIGQTSDAFDRAPIVADRNAAFPLDRLRELAAAGAIGAVAPRHVSFNGSMTAPGRFTAETAPQVAGQLERDAVDAALLVPV
ncbi:MAG: glycine/sarcosine/betaine reductase selenoprotein B family protein [Gemmatimonadales bacterium]|nr:glycine/sarcosine/betaine reductase selenoprotein B family protein [Gemmatimonadales bacterium]